MYLRIDSLGPGRYTWQLGYGTPGDDERPYLLLPVNEAAGQWIIDERNGIELQSYQQGNCFYSAFSVMGSLLLTRDELLEDNLMLHEIISGSDQAMISGDTILNPDSAQADTIPPVGSYPLRSIQKALLRRKSPTPSE